MLGLFVKVYILPEGFFFCAIHVPINSYNVTAYNLLALIPVLMLESKGNRQRKAFNLILQANLSLYVNYCLLVIEGRKTHFCRHIPGFHTGSSRMIVFSSRKDMQQMNIQMRMNLKDLRKHGPKMSVLYILKIPI